MDFLHVIFFSVIFSLHNHRCANWAKIDISITLFVGPSKTTFDSKNCGKLRYDIMHTVIWAKYNIKWSNVRRFFCKQCRQVKFNGTMIKRPVQKQTLKTAQNTQNKRQDATDIQNKLFLFLWLCQLFSILDL